MTILQLLNEYKKCHKFVTKCHGFVIKSCDVFWHDIKLNWKMLPHVEIINAIQIQLTSVFTCIWLLQKMVNLWRMIHFTLFSSHSTTWHPQGENIHRGGITTIFWNNLNSCKQRLTDSWMWLNKATSVNIFISFQFNFRSRADHVVVGQYFYMICRFTCRSNGVKWIIPRKVTCRRYISPKIT